MLWPRAKTVSYTHLDVYKRQEAVVNEFNAALANAKEIVAKDGATQQEINDATERLLKVMAKVDWKQGDKTVLEVAVDIANTIKPDLDLYVEEGKQEFLDALAKAEEVLALSLIHI